MKKQIELKTSIRASIKEFWEFFEQNHRKLVDNDEVVDENQYIDLLDKLKDIHGNLSLEVGASTRPRELVITADGMEEIFEFIDLIFETEPKVAGWKFIKYRQARDDIEDQTVTVGDETFVLSEVLFDLVYDEHAGIVVIMFIPGYDPENNAHETLRWTILDNTIGEHDAVKKVGYFDTYSKDEIASLDKELTSTFKSLKHLKKDLNDMWDEVGTE